MHCSREESHSAIETLATKPAQHLLRSVREKDYSHRQPQERRCGVTICGNELLEHCAKSFLFFFIGTPGVPGCSTSSCRIALAGLADVFDHSLRVPDAPNEIEFSGERSESAATRC